VSALCCGTSDAVVVQVDDSEGITIAIITRDGLAAEGLALEVGETESFEVELTDASGLSLGTVTPTWSSTSPAVASVTSGGMVTALSAGSTTIEAAYQGMNAAAAIMVTVASTPPTGPGPQVLFHSDWSTATGSSSSALRDTDKSFPWGVVRGEVGGAQHRVVSAASVGYTRFPTANLLEIRNLSDGSPMAGVGVKADVCSQCIPIPGVGESLYYRWYMAFTEPDWYTGDRQNHDPTDGTGPAGSSSNNWEWRTYNRSGYWIGCIGIQGSTDFDTFMHCVEPLQKNTVYMIEVQFERISSTQHRMHGRISDADGNLLFDDSDFESWGAPGHYLDEEPVQDTNHLDLLRGVFMGSNGWSADPTTDFVAWYKAGMAVCANDWCGPYPIADQEN
jgi:hypothetical protein